MQHVPIIYILSRAHSSDDRLAYLTHRKHAGCPSDRHRVKPKANRRGCEGNKRQGERERERAINKVTVVFIHHASEKTDEDLPVPLAPLAFHWTIWHLHHRVS